MYKGHVSRVRFRTPFIFSPRHRYHPLFRVSAHCDFITKPIENNRSAVYISLPRAIEKRRLNSSSTKYVCFEKPPSRARHCCFLMDFGYPKIIHNVLYLRKSVGTKKSRRFGARDADGRKKRKRLERRIAVKEVACFRSRRTTARALSPIL